MLDPREAFVLVRVYAFAASQRATSGDLVERPFKRKVACEVLPRLDCVYFFQGLGPQLTRAKLGQQQL